MRIGFAGDGHLLTYAFAAAKTKGFDCVKYKAGGGLGSGYLVSDLHECDIVYICPDRPGYYEPQDLLNSVLPHLRSDAVLVIHCQVIPGFTRKIAWQNRYYHVETLRMGDAMDRAVNPERIIVGHAGYIDPRLHQFFISFSCPIVEMSYESAELAKIAINLYLAAQVSTTNTLSEIAESIGANWHEIIPALQSDKRIGKEAYLKPGYGLSKHLIRDLQTVMGMAGNTDVMKAFLEHSEYRRMLEHTPQL